MKVGQSDGTTRDEMVVTGSNAKFIYPFSANTSDYPVPLPFTARDLLIVNDGTGILNIAFDGNSSQGAYHPFTDSTWVNTGTWFAGPILGSNSENSSDTGTPARATFKPGTLLSIAFIWNMVVGSAAGIAKVELSKDNGITWVNPSTISGITRSDGATGAAMDTYDQYSSGTALASVTYNLPYDTVSTWAMRITPNGTKNASSTGTAVYVVGATAKAPNILTVNSKETFDLQIQTKQFNISSPTSTTGRVIAI